MTQGCQQIVLAFSGEVGPLRSNRPGLVDPPRESIETRASYCCRVNSGWMNRNSPQAVDFAEPFWRYCPNVAH